MSMPSRKDDRYTSEDYWNLPEGVRAELIGGRLYNMAPPSRIHQKLIVKFIRIIDTYIQQNNGACEIYPGPFAVNLDAEDRDWVEPDVSVICDPEKLTDRGCEGAPDWIIEIVSPSNQAHDYSRKHALYEEAGVREYWIVDPEKKRVTVYFYENGSTPTLYSFDQSVPCGIFPGLEIRVSELL